MLPFRPIPQLTEEEISRFWSKVDKRGVDDCWHWAASRRKHGYGQLVIHRNQNIGAHRLAYFLSTRIDPGPLDVCHQCDTPSCCNPAHLFLGTARDNLADCRAKQRHGAITHPDNKAFGDRNGSRKFPERLPRGEDNPNSVLTVAVVRAIRDEYECGGISHRRLAEKFGVAKRTVSMIVNRQTWKHVQ